ncbi:MAG TPA: NAD(P)/FAD-dependent oxidoreductase [Solirubrobacteraceae bacterium]|nr:NAD(P)/FAD-dependent oxidoreductase [Solirubrobacteraceae bacterium]
MQELALSRRQFIGAAGAAAVSVAAWTPRARAATPAKVVVVGGGLAGLTCAYRLKQAGVAAELHEASDRLGGRCWSIRGAFGPGLVAEHGGELIDTGHLDIRQLAKELGFATDNLFQGETNGTEPLYYFDGKPYTEEEAAADFNAVYQKLHKDTSAASFPTTYRISTQRGRELDAMTITEWIEESVPGGVRSRFGQLLDVAYNIEFGAECDQQSALNLIYLLGYVGQGQLRLFGKSNEKFHVRGGNDQLAQAMATALGGQITRGSQLVAIAQTSGGRFTLTFLQGTTTKTITADRVVLALPFSLLRTVDYSKAGFGLEKTRAIRELPMGTNSKLNVGFKTRHWRSLGCTGDTYADTGYQATWEVSRGQPGTAGILVDYTGGKIGDSFGSGTPVQRAQKFLGQIEPVLPGITKQFDGNATVDYWATYPWTLGSYSYYKPGQYTRFGGAEPEISGACHFAGEHTTQDFQGYLQGAVITGERAAAEVLDAL